MTPNHPLQRTCRKRPAAERKRWAHMRLPPFLIALSLATSPLLSGCTETNTAEARVRAYLEIPQSVKLNERTVREALLLKIPIGTSAQQVAEKLSAAGIGKDKLSSYIAPDANGKASIKIDYDPQTFGIAKTSYFIPMVFTPEMTLADVEVKAWRTGP